MFYLRNIVLCLLVNNVICDTEDVEIINNVIGNDKVEVLSSENSSTSVKPEVTTKPKQTVPLVCPNKSTRVPFFSPTCKTAKDCSFLGSNLVCCNSRCLRGVLPPKAEPTHNRIFGIIDRVCLQDPMPEFLPIKECITDVDCGARICCPEKPPRNGVPKNYCRSPAPRFTRMPNVRQFLEPLRSFASYLQCSAPPPPILDVFPKLCETTFDCFPSLCCQEYGKKVCRPPKKSFFALIASAATRVGTTAIAKSFIQRIS